MLDRIYCTEEQIERANKALRLNGGSDSAYNYPRLLAAFFFEHETNAKDKAIRF